jgi:hypothetical protein
MSWKTKACCKCRAAGTDGKAIGADIDAIEAALQKVQ